MAPNKTFPLLVEETLYLRPLEEKDASSLFKLIDANRKYLKEFLGWLDLNTSLEDSLNFIKEEKNKRDSLDALTLGIYVSDQLKGMVGLNSIDALNKNASIGYWLSEDEQGHGIMTKCVKKLIEFSFQRLNLHRLELRSATLNKKSQKIPEKLGFQKEGVLKEAIYHYGKYFDAYTYALIKTS